MILLLYPLHLLKHYKSPINFHCRLIYGKYQFNLLFRKKNVEANQINVQIPSRQKAKKTSNKCLKNIPIVSSRSSSSDSSTTSSSSYSPPSLSFCKDKVFHQLVYITFHYILLRQRLQTLLIHAYVLLLFRVKFGV